MGLHESSGRSTVFLVVKHHAICMESSVAQDGFEEISVENPKTKKMVTKYIKKFDGVDGYVTKIEWKDTKQEYAERYLGFVIHMRDGVDEFKIDLPFDQVPYRAFVKFAENIDYTKPVYFSAWHDRKKDCNAFGAMQDNKWIKHAFTIDSPNGMPPPVDDGLGKLNFRKQAVWLKERIENVVIPRVDAAEKARQEEAKLKEPAPKTQAAPAGKSDPADDPFPDDMFTDAVSDTEMPFDDDIPF